VIAAVETCDLSFHYRDAPVLRDIRICFNPGEMVAVLGPNGSGKTTLLKALSGVLLGTGEVKVKGRPVKSYGKRDLSRIFAVVPQESLVQFPYTVAELVLMGRASRHGAFALEGKKDVEVARACMQFTGVLPLAQRYLHELSGGEKQRVMIARALAQEPEILLLDEPAAFLDVKHQLQIFTLLRRLNRERRLTIIAALHDLNLAALFFPRLVLLCDGRLYGDGPAANVLTTASIEAVYGVRVRIDRDPQDGQLQIHYSLPG
jgi:iron complex transport system ATP-binding protein